MQSCTNSLFTRLIHSLLNAPSLFCLYTSKRILVLLMSNIATFPGYCQNWNAISRVNL